MVKKFPLLLIPVIIYNAMVFGGEMLSRYLGIANEGFARTIFSIPMGSGALWSVTSGDVILFAAVILLFAELIKTTNHGPKPAISHTVSLALFIVCLVEFLLIPAFASSLFFMIAIISLLDVIAGYMISTPMAGERISDEDDYAD